MLCAHTPERYPAGEREKWQCMAKELLREVSSGVLSYDDFAEAIKLTDKNEDGWYRMCVRYQPSLIGTR